MEARSLSSLNSLAANPPQYPERPFDENEEPLVLYISRVPGTRDVILSPFKPQVKNVTGQDVANSLYYAHLEMSHPELPPLAIQDPGQGRPSEDSPLSIPRKPLPGNLGALMPDGLPGSSQIQLPAGGQENEAPIRSTQDEAVAPLSHYQPASAYSEPFPDVRLGYPTDIPDQPPPPPPPHKYFVLPSRKPAGPMAIVDLPEPKRDSLIPETRIDGVPTENVLAGESVQAFDHARRPSHHRSHSRSPSPTKRSRSASLLGSPFTLTLIRRDPSSGSQWNVGRICSHQVEPLPTDDDDTALGLLSTSPPPASQWSSSAARPPIDVYLETSGYAKYRRMPPKMSMDGSAGAPSAAALKAMALAGAPAEDFAVNRGEIGVFSRQVVMEYSKSWTSNLRDKLQRLEKSGRAGKSHVRNGSDGSTDSVGSNASAGEHAAGSVGHPSRGMKPRGYTFNSPWDGKCEFRTGHGGRSLRCQHILHDGQSAPYNPLLADQGSNVPRSAAATISELRFNLPGSELFSDQPRDTKAQIRGHFNKLLRATRGEHDEGDQDDDDDVMSPFDTNVGSENAGGGNSGKRAKLGKLIIYSEGLKMLDLVVAANIGVWWGAWERSF